MTLKVSKIIIPLCFDPITNAQALDTLHLQEISSHTGPKGPILMPVSLGFPTTYTLPLSRDVRGAPMA